MKIQAKSFKLSTFIFVDVSGNVYVYISNIYAVYRIIFKVKNGLGKTTKM